MKKVVVKKVLGKVVLLPVMLVGANISIALAEDGWSGKGEGGISVVSGNSESETISAGLELSKTAGNWEHSAELSVLKAEAQVEVRVTDAMNNTTVTEESQTTAESYLAGWKTNYSFSERSYAYGELRFLDDKFDSFESITSYSAGYGYKVLQRKDVKWSVSLGLGYKDTEYTVEKFSDADLLVAGLERDIGEANVVVISKYSNKITDTTSFSNDTRYEAGSDNSYAQNVAALSVKMTDALALKLKYDVRYNSDPAPTDTSTDRISSVNIVYSF